MSPLITAAKINASTLGRIGQPSAAPSPMIIAEPENHSEHAADEAEDDGLDEELQEDVVLARADGHTNADLARSLGDAHEHDVHHADPADDEAHRGDAEEKDPRAGR